MSSIGHELLNVPFGDMVLQLAYAIAEGQYQLDKTSCEIAKLMGSKEECTVSLPDPNNIDKYFDTTLLGAGFQPTFYQFTDTIIEVKISITISQSRETNASVSAKAKFLCFSASVNASYSSKYSYTAEGASLIRTCITPVPPNAYLQNLLDIRTQKLQESIDK